MAETIKRTAFRITRMGQLVALEASKRLGVAFGIVDLSLAPTPRGRFGRAHIGGNGPGKMRHAREHRGLGVLNDAVKKGGVMASSHVGGLSGAFIPVSEESV